MLLLKMVLSSQTSLYQEYSKIQIPLCFLYTKVVITLMKQLSIYKTMYKAIDIPLSEAKHKYEPDQDDMITDEELNAEYEKMDEDLVEIEKKL